jgi:peroxidase
LKDAKSFCDTAKEIVDFKNRELLSQLYNDDPNLADLWVAGLAETPANGGIVGATFGCIIREQMRRVRDGDRFYYEKEGVFSEEQLAEIRNASMSRILCDNLANIVSVQRDSFRAGTVNNRVLCDRIPDIDLSKWRSEGSTGGAASPGMPYF